MDFHFPTKLGRLDHTKQPSEAKAKKELVTQFVDLRVAKEGKVGVCLTECFYENLAQSSRVFFFFVEGG